MIIAIKTMDIQALAARLEAQKPGITPEATGRETRSEELACIMSVIDAEFLRRNAEGEKARSKEQDDAQMSDDVLGILSLEVSLQGMGVVCAS